MRQEVHDLRAYQHRCRDEIATSPLSQSSLEERLHEIEGRTETLEKAQDTKHAELCELLDNIKDEVAELENTVEEEVGKVGLEVVDLDGRMAAGFSEINARLDIISNAMEIQRNSMATRFYATVHPLSILGGNGAGVQQGVAGKTVQWYWKCHDPKYRISSPPSHPSQFHANTNSVVNRLVNLHEFYSLDFNNWYNASNSDSDSDDDSTDLNHPVPEPSSIREAAQLRPKRAVMALFSHLGLPYHVFEEQTERSHFALTERKRAKNDEAETKGRKIKQRYVGRDGISFSGSPTDVNASPTQSAVTTGD